MICLNRLDYMVPSTCAMWCTLYGEYLVCLHKSWNARAPFLSVFLCCICSYHYYCRAILILVFHCICGDVQHCALEILDAIVHRQKYAIESGTKNLQLKLWLQHVNVIMNRFFNESPIYRNVITFDVLR